jgi:UDP-N-acetylmuramyl pentapeptide phosphotransferase/UDP-N-acetylglucosamine-1-phosphate transferase
MTATLELGLVVMAAAAASACLIVPLRPWLERYALAHLNARSSHRQPTPQGGGIAVIAATVVVAAGAVAAGFLGARPSPAALGLVFAATALIALVGAIDDIRTIEVVPRLFLQALAVAVMLASLPAELRIVPTLPWWLERALLLLGCLWVVNMTNFMDGIDWMTVAEFIPITLGIAVIGRLAPLPAEAVIVALALCGGLLGFAPFNRPVARLFLGDVGSLPLGLLLAWLLVLLAGNGHLAAAIVLPLYYLADATLTLMLRIANREPVWKAHRTHFYQRATDRGWSVIKIVRRVFVVNAGLATLACISVLSPTWPVEATCLLAAMALTGWLLRNFARGKP